MKVKKKKIIINKKKEFKYCVRPMTATRFKKNLGQWHQKNVKCGEML